MMGRLSGYEEKNHGQIAQGNFLYSADRDIAQSRNTPNDNLLYQGNETLPLIPNNHFRSQSSQSNRTSLTTRDLLPGEARAQSSYQGSISSVQIREPKSVRSCTTSPTFKLPPIPPVKSTFEGSNIMPPQSSTEIPIAALHSYEPDNVSKDGSSIMDMKIAYENMMMGYFMQQQKSVNTDVPGNVSDEHLKANPINPNQFIDSDTKAFYSQTTQQTSQNTPYFSENFNLPYGTLPQELCQKVQPSQTFQNQLSNQIQRSEERISTTPRTSQQQAKINLSTSRCSHKNKPDLYIHGQLENLSNCISTQVDKQFKQESSSSTEVSNLSSKAIFEHSEQLRNNPSSSTSILAAELPMFIPTQGNININPMFSTQNVRTSSSSEMNPPSLNNVVPASTSIASVPYQTKTEPNWGSFTVLPPVIPSVTPSGGVISDGDTISLLSYASSSNNAQTIPQIGTFNNMFSPLSMNFDSVPSAFNISPRYSTRSSYSNRSRNKRALSNSPLSADSIDINTIIRMSPTSLNAYLNGSRSSSSCVSPGSNGDKTGCYGHLSARNSSSPQSLSGSSGNRRSASYTPQTDTPMNSNPSNIASDNSNISMACNEIIKNDFLMLDDNLLVIQAMQDLETGAGLPVFPSPFNNNVNCNAQLAPEYENLQVLPQDLAAFHTEDYIPFIPSVLPPIHLPPQFNSSSQALPPAMPHTKPPPTYDQHMARKATLQKNSSSDSSQPSNSNSSSFESSEGDKTIAGSSGTDTESNRMHACRWLDCSAVFQDQDDFVTHIEKVHIDQKKGDDYVCFWKLCPRRLHPFNARYKLLVHMRIHSGDKPNKCTYSGCNKAFSRLENLKIHLRSHTGERPYSCTFQGCTKTFSNSSDRTKHQKTHHETKPYVCQFTGCGKRYTDPSSLRKHVKKSHPEKKEPDRKKIRSAVEELDPRDLDECLVIHSIKPITLYDASPPEPTDSGLGRSPRSSKPGSSSDYYPGFAYSSETQGTSSQTSPTSQHSSPPVQINREKLPPNNNSLRVPILPPITPSPVQQQLFSSVSSPLSNYSSGLVRAPTPSTSSLSRNSSSLLQTQKLTSDSLRSSLPAMHTAKGSKLRTSESFTPEIRHQTRYCS